ncbi:MAG: hypothetical protein ABIP97_04665 [Chthoniobacterales bacterium]
MSSLPKNCTACLPTTDGDFLCVCSKVTLPEFHAYCKKHPGESFEFFKETYKVSAGCTSCETEVRSLLDDFSTPEVSTTHSFKKRLQKSSALLKQRRLRDALRFGTKDSISGVFFLSSPELFTSLVISNLPIPESGTNLNRSKVKYRVTLYDGTTGHAVAIKRGTVRSGENIELNDTDLLPSKYLNKFAGYAIVQFLRILSTASLRQYGVLQTRTTDAPQSARVHYHDKYTRAEVPGYYQTPRALGSRFKTYMAVSNPGTATYESEWVFSAGKKTKTGKFQLRPGYSTWLDLEDYIGIPHEEVSAEVVTTFCLKNPQPLMAWFFWHDRQTGGWHGQHF